MKKTIFSLSTALLGLGSAHAATIVQDTFDGSGSQTGSGTDQSTNPGIGNGFTLNITAAGGGFQGIEVGSGTMEFTMNGGSGEVREGAAFSNDLVAFGGGITSSTFTTTYDSVVAAQALGTTASSDPGITIGFAPGIGGQANVDNIFGFRILENGVHFNDGSGFTDLGALSTTTGTFASAGIGDGFTTSISINQAANTYSATLNAGTFTYVITDAAFTGNLGNRYATLGLAKDNDGGTNVGSTISEVMVTAIPEPSATALLGLGGLALILRRRR